MMDEEEEFRRLVRRDTGSDLELVLLGMASVAPMALLSTAGPWWRVLGSSLTVAGGVVIFWWQRARYASPDWLAILGAIGRGRPRPLARALSPLLTAAGAWYFGALTIILGLANAWNSIQQALDPQPPAARVRRVVVLVSSPLSPGPLADLDLDAARHWPSLVRHDGQLALPESRPFIASIPGVDAKDPRMRGAARNDARTLEHEMCAWSQRYPEIKFAFVKGECRGTRCDYRGHVCQNDMPLAGSDGGPDGATELLKHLGVELSDDLMAAVRPAPLE
jgi:hypothetical protein